MGSGKGGGSCPDIFRDNTVFEQTLIDIINEYKASDLFLFHRDFDGQEDIPRGLALEYAKKEERIPDWTRNILHFPNPFGAPGQKAYWLCLRYIKIRHSIGRRTFSSTPRKKKQISGPGRTAVALWKTGKLRVL